MLPTINNNKRSSSVQPANTKKGKNFGEGTEKVEKDENANDENL